MDDEDVTEESSPGMRQPSVWLRPGGISAIAGVAAVVVSVIGILIAMQPGSSTSSPSSSNVDQDTKPALFVYGSSMPGQSRYGEIEEYVIEIDKDSVEGLLYDSGLGYPMAKFGPGDDIPGYVLWLDPETAEDVLIEQTRLESGLFHPVPVRTAGGVTATAYEWIEATDGFPRIDQWDGTTGDFGQLVDTATLRLADCYGPSSLIDSVIITLCDAPHAYEVFFSEQMAEVADERRAAQRCRSEFEAFIGADVGASSLSIQVVRPSSELGRLTCAVFAPDELMTGTMAGSNR